MSAAEVVPPKDRHELYVWVVDWAGDDAQAYVSVAPKQWNGDNHQAALNADPRRGNEESRSKSRAALVKITVPLAEMKRLGE